MKTKSGLITWVLTAMTLCVVSAQATTFYFDNSESNGLWTAVENWHDQYTPVVTNTLNEFPDDPSDIATIIPGPDGGSDNTCIVNSNITIRSIRNNWTTQNGVSEVIDDGVSTLTITGTAANNPGFLNQSGTAGGRLLLNCDVVVTNTGAGVNDLTQVLSANSPDSTVEFGTNSTLTLRTPLVTLNGYVNAIGSNIEFNGTLSSNSTAFVIIQSANVSFNDGHDSSAFSPEIVFYSNAKLAVNGGTVLSSTNKFQFNGNNSELELNGAHAINGANISVALTNSMLIDANSDQNNMGWVEFPGDATVTIDLDAAVTNLSFADSSTRPWGGFGSLIITNFMSEVVRFGTNDTAITLVQFNLITAFDASGSLVPDLAINTDGYLTGTVTPTETPTSLYTDWCSLYPTLTNTDMTYDAEPDGVVNLMEYALGGDPTVDDAAAISPSASLEDIAGTTYLFYIYERRTDALARGLSYAVLSGTDLTAGPLATPTIDVGSGASTSGFETVTNAISTASEDTQFMGLSVEFTE